MVLLDAHWVAVPSRKVRLQIALDVMLHPKSLAQVNHSQRVITPVDDLAVLAKVVGFADFEQIHEPMRGLYDCQAELHVKGGLQRNPSEDVSSLFRRGPL